MTFLIHAEYDIDMVNVDGDSALHLACKVGGICVTKGRILIMTLRPKPPPPPPPP
jgi:hypothetical protein